VGVALTEGLGVTAELWKWIPDKLVQKILTALLYGAIDLGASEGQFVVNHVKAVVRFVAKLG
jgi:hypothetical protein